MKERGVWGLDRSRAFILIFGIIIVSGLAYSSYARTSGESEVEHGEGLKYEATYIGVFSEGAQFSTSPSINLGEGGLIVH